jgi:hypothetical protein
MKRLVLPLALAGALALPGAALAAQVKISPRAVSVSAAGAATIEVANPTRHALRGTAAVAVGGRTVASRGVRLPKRAVTGVKLRFGAAAMEALRGAAGKATIRLAVRRSGGRKLTARRTLNLRLPSGSPQPPAPGPTGGPDSGGPAGGPASDRWVGRMGTEGPYDDFELTVDGGQMTLTKPAFVPVACFEMGGLYRQAVSLELFDAAGPWTIGTEGMVEKSAPSVNSIVQAGARSITYKVTDTAQAAGKLTGTLAMSFFDSRLDIFNGYKIIFTNCSGAQSFEAVPAG